MSVFKKLRKEPKRQPVVIYKLLVFDPNKNEWLFYKWYFQKRHAKSAITNAVDAIEYTNGKCLNNKQRFRYPDEKVRLVEFATDKIVWEGWLSAWNAEKDTV